jgi:hypothetical protein
MVIRVFAVSEFQPSWPPFGNSWMVLDLLMKVKDENGYPLSEQAKI